jgi:plastocyanin
VKLFAAVLVIAGAFVPAGAADAPGIVAATFPNRFTPPNVVVLEGRPLLFAQLDAQPHDLMSFDTDENGEPLFWTGRPLQLGEVMPVTGVEHLEPGPYLFLCNLHTGMWGELVVVRTGV